MFAMKTLILSNEQKKTLGLPENECHVILSWPLSETQEIAKRLHDLKAASRRLSTMREMIGDGFNFSEPAAKDLLRQLDEALTIIQSELKVHTQVLSMTGGSNG